MPADIYSVFGNRIRAKLILCLARKPKNVTQMIRVCGLAQSAVSQHLTKLKDAGLVRSRKEGKEIFYYINHSKAVRISELLETLEKELL